MMHDAHIRHAHVLDTLLRFGAGRVQVFGTHHGFRVIVDTDDGDMPERQLPRLVAAFAASGFRTDDSAASRHEYRFVALDISHLSQPAVEEMAAVA